MMIRLLMALLNWVFDVLASIVDWCHRIAIVATTTSPRDDHVVIGERALMGAREIQRADRATMKAHRQTVNGPEALGDGSRRKRWPSTIGFTQRLVRDGESVTNAVDAGALIRMNLKELQQFH